jgi:hypothetical protein
MDPRVLDAILPYLTDLYGNPHSRTHAYGWEAETAVEKARAQVASLIGASSKDIIFTSGATESNNMLIKGIARFYKQKRNHIITTQTEHKCVLDSCRYLAEQGFEVTYLPVKSDGLVDLEVLKAAIKPTTCLVSIMAVNNEIGVIQPLQAIGDLLRAHQKANGGPKIFFHSDIAQATGKIPLDVEKMGLDAASISGHKLYGPKGIGAAYVRRRPRVRLEPLIHGGGQERGLRSGTVPTFLTVGLGEACRIAQEEMEVSRGVLVVFFSWSRPSARLLFPALGLSRLFPKRFPPNVDVKSGEQITRKRNVRTGRFHHGFNDNETSVLIAMERLEMMTKNRTGSISLFELVIVQVDLNNGRGWMEERTRNFCAGVLNLDGDKQPRRERFGNEMRRGDRNRRRFSGVWMRWQRDQTFYSVTFRLTLIPLAFGSPTTPASRPSRTA